MVALRKVVAGSDSFGNVWLRDGAVIDVPPEQAVVLLRIKDAGITEAPSPVPELSASKPTARPAAKR